VSFAAITLCVASERVFVVISVYFVIDSVRKLLDIPLHFFVVRYLVEPGDNFTFSFTFYFKISVVLVCGPQNYFLLI
jgi:hypothetical protein